MIGITGSPSTESQVAFQVLADHMIEPLNGSLVYFSHTVRIGNTHREMVVLGQVSHLENKNPYHEDPSFATYIKAHGHIPHLSENGNYTVGNIEIIGAYLDGKERITVTVPPPSGLPIYRVTQDMVMQMIQQEEKPAFIGEFYGSPGVLAPVDLKHFGDALKSGSGEAYMGGIFGPTGSGKTVMAMTMVSLWTAASPEMGFLLLDPHSEFSKNSIGGGTGFSFNLHQMLQTFSHGRFDPKTDVISIDRIKMDDPAIFTRLLRDRRFFKAIGLSDQKVADVLEPMTDWLQDHKIGKEIIRDGLDYADVCVKDPDFEEKTLPDILSKCYAITGRREYHNHFVDEIRKERRNIEQIWNQCITMFKKSRSTINDVIKESLFHGRIRIIDLNPDHLNLTGYLAHREEYKVIFMNAILKKIRQETYKTGQNKPNCLVVMDEASRFIPQHVTDDNKERDKRQMVDTITRYVRELRKFQIGFFFITQSVSEINKEIYKNLHFTVYGPGLGIGSEEHYIVDKEGKNAFDLYRKLPNPRKTGKFTFMMGGHLSMLGTTDNPIFIQAFGSDQAILEKNKHLL